jgi:hypothetical protein
MTEPVAIFKTNLDGGYVDLLAFQGQPLLDNTPLYITPPQRKPLTDEEIIDHFKASVDTGFLLSFVDGVRYAEAAHGIKEKKI